MCGFYSLVVSILEKCGKFRKNGRFSGRIWPDWGNTARADMAGLGSIGLREMLTFKCVCRKTRPDLPTLSLILKIHTWN